MANLKLHTFGIHGGFHHNFLYTVVRTVLQFRLLSSMAWEDLHVIDMIASLFLPGNFHPPLNCHRFT